MNELHKLIIAGEYQLKDDISEESRDLLKKILEKDPEKRIKIDEILEHSWLQNIKTDIDIFTATEKDIMRIEFTYNDTDRLNRNTQVNDDEDTFTDHNLDSTFNSLVKNNSTKSVILAPFNSTKSHFSDLHSSMEEIMYKKGEKLKLAPRIRDFDRQYEFNNNCELDNGVYNKNVIGTEEDEKEAKEKGDEQLETEKSMRLDDVVPTDPDPFSASKVIDDLNGYPGMTPDQIEKYQESASKNPVLCIDQGVDEEPEF